MDLTFSTMAARSDLSPAQWRRPFLNWLDGIEAGWAIPLLLLGFIVVWLAFLIIAYLGGDLHSDVLETWSFGRSIEWGYSKHPPLMGWVAHLWTQVFPLTGWSFQLPASWLPFHYPGLQCRAVTIHPFGPSYLGRR